MRTFQKPTIFISACIEHLECRYDGTTISDDHVKRLKQISNVITKCPEVSIGLGIPREALRLVYDKDTEKVSLVSSAKGIDYTEKMETFSKDYSNKIKDKDIDGFILKAKSPSCGTHNVKMYYGIGKAHSVSSKNPGLFGKQIIEDYPNVPIENERRLSNFNIRDQFYTKLFMLSEFKHLKNNFTYKGLVKFHSENKYLYMTYNQNILKEMGQVVANHKKLPNEVVIKQYEDLLQVLFSKEPTKQKRINVLTHIYGYFKDKITDQEKAHYFDVLDDYLNGTNTYKNVLSILYTYCLRFDEKYLIPQTIFIPYPKELTSVLDSGKEM